MAPLSERRRAVLTMLQVNGMSIEEVARATASTIGAINQDAHGAYDRAHTIEAANTPKGGVIAKAALSRSSITTLAHVANS